MDKELVIFLQKAFHDAKKETWGEVKKEISKPSLGKVRVKEIERRFPKNANFDDKTLEEIFQLLKSTKKVNESFKNRVLYYLNEEMADSKVENQPVFKFKNSITKKEAEEIRNTIKGNGQAYRGLYNQKNGYVYIFSPHLLHDQVIDKFGFKDQRDKIIRLFLFHGPEHMNIRGAFVGGQNSTPVKETSAHYKKIKSILI